MQRASHRHEMGIVDRGAARPDGQDNERVGGGMSEDAVATVCTLEHETGLNQRALEVFERHSLMHDVE